MMSSPSTGEEHAAQPCAVPSLGPHTDGDLHFDVRAQATARGRMNKGKINQEDKEIGGQRQEGRFTLASMHE